MTDQRPETQEPGADPRRWRALAVTLAAGFMTLLDVSIVNVALPSIQRGLGASPQAAQWVVSGYALTFGLVLVTGGRLGDLLGRRRMFLISLTAFIVTSAIAGAAPTAATLVVARLVQGLAAGMMTPQNTGLIQQLFTGEERAKAFGVFGTTVGISTAAGPVIGGLILAAFGEHDGWRYVFYVNVPIGLVALVLTMRLVPAGPPRTKSITSQLDVVGVLLLGAAVLCVLLPLVQSDNGGSPLLWLLVPVAAGLGAGFLRWEHRVTRHGRSPLLDTRLFSQVRGFSPGLALGTIYFCGFSGIWLVLSLFLQNGLGYSPLRSGLTVTPFALGSAATAVVAGRLVTRWGRRLTVTGLCLVVVGLGTAGALMTVVPAHALGYVLIAPLLVAGIGGGAVVSPNTTLTLECVPTRMAGAAGGALQTGQRIGTAVGTAVLATAFRFTTNASHGDYPTAAGVAMACAVGFQLAALLLAVLELRAIRIAEKAATTADAQDRRDATASADVQR
ncbi:MAG TPA: MFS transporter [Pseudonocardiaceae bacterium]|nr:MFS transporter [Pseudonocardiaceae bacterium]